MPAEAMMALVFDGSVPVPGGTIAYAAPFGVGPDGPRTRDLPRGAVPAAGPPSARGRG